ncbi:cytochrome c oxidase assembly protein [Marilutibacter alkalisoli]|uniref:Cytochrome c oxidase assembly protein CtaG n=1 Tax=Marilutibacter alkalisoli TaxID=2591633 RepID=A0A514BN92_9GAMM|nr:cytochrome c oxidase assembly protein [Lysobacter alkalisoli]QDH68858.1 cytochrome c oxidase assembly protein [Lysobacter alkalisoli]
MSASGSTGRMTVIMVGVGLCAFAFSFALVPLYRIACEKVFGIRLERSAVEGQVAALPVEERWVTVEFDGGVNSKLPWSFRPNQTTMRVQVGQPYDTTYYAHNDSDRIIVGSAVPSVAPARASGYFNKTECFCFTAQTLHAGETRDMPVRFIIDPALPADVSTVTLSYTFFKNDVLTERLALSNNDVPTTQQLAASPHGNAASAPRSAP